MLKLLLKKKQEYKDKLKEIKNKQYEIENKILDYVFPKDKHEGKTIAEMITKDIGYVKYWLVQNDLSDSDAFTEVYYLQSVIETRNRLKRLDAEDEYERRRMKYCKQHSINYNIDYACRHNPAMRDFGM